MRIFVFVYVCVCAHAHVCIPAGARGQRKNVFLHQATLLPATLLPNSTETGSPEPGLTDWLDWLVSQSWGSSLRSPWPLPPTLGLQVYATTLGFYF